MKIVSAEAVEVEGKPKRKPLSKRTRFEILKRDRFACLYCGATPITRPLHVDHVKPVAEGGTNAPENLVTACIDCNAGKGPVPLEQRRYPAPVSTEADREHAAQILEYLALQREVEASRREATDAFADYWEDRMGPMSQKMYDKLANLLKTWPYEKLVEAVNITARKLGTPGEEFNYRDSTSQSRYFQGILRRWRAEQEATDRQEYLYQRRVEARDALMAQCEPRPLRVRSEDE